MADRYLKATGNWNDNNTWSATDGGTAGESFPTAGDNVYLTANGNGLTLTLVVGAACDLLTASGGCTTTLAGTDTITVGGNVTLLSVMTIANTWTWTITGTGNFATNGITTLGAINLNGTAHTVTGDNTFKDWTIAGSATVTLGSTTQTCSSFLNSGTIVVGNHTIIITGANADGRTFAGNDQTFNHVRVEGAGAYTLTITGDNTFEKLRNDSSVAVKTILLTPASTQTIRNLQVFSSASKVAVFNTGGATATIQNHRGYCELNHVSLTNIVATEKYRYYAGNNSTDGTGNTNWLFTHKARHVE